jgi:tRNA dimethylallyltransferase
MTTNDSFSGHRPIVVVGPTAAGKTAHSIALAEQLGGEIVNADSMQVYRGMDIGTAKPSPEIRRRVPHHLIDLVEPWQTFSVAEYREASERVLEGIRARGTVPIVCGGTGLYVDALLYEMDFSGGGADEGERQRLQDLAREQGAEAVHAILRARDAEAAARIHPNNLKRVIRALERLATGGEGGQLRGFAEARRPGILRDPVIHLITWPREELIRRIDARVEQMFADGLVREMEGLLAQGMTESHQSMQAIGYKELFPYLRGESTLDETKERICIHTRQYAKRQTTWFARYSGTVQPT